MILLRRNCTEFQYYAYTGLESDIDEETGLHTGNFKPVYADPKFYRGNISAPSGSTRQAFDGLEVRYTHVLLMDDPEADIHEYGKIRYKNRMYTITAVIPSLNVLSVALIVDTYDFGDQDVHENVEEEPLDEQDGN